MGTLVFDEVDTGVSGRAAQKVAEKLAQVSRRKQVLCVTHLPQLAAMADTHFSVKKGESKGRTYTHVVLLDREARKAELARITGGSQSNGGTAGKRRGAAGRGGGVSVSPKGMAPPFSFELRENGRWSRPRENA